MTQKSTSLCMGLDPDPEKIPQELLHVKEPFFNFCWNMLKACVDSVVCVKIQIAYFSAYGKEQELEKLIQFIKKDYPDLPVILDAKRADIANTNRLYAKELFDRYQADAVTLNPYLGLKVLDPFLKYSDKGIFLLCKTSNKDADFLQNYGETFGQKKLYLELVIELLKTPQSYEQVGLVVGATQPKALKEIRQMCEKTFFLCPGIGAQGGSLAGLKQAAQKNFLASASRSILYASNNANDCYASAQFEASQLTKEMQELL